MLVHHLHGADLLGPVEQCIGQRPTAVAGDPGGMAHALPDEVVDDDLGAGQASGWHPSILSAGGAERHGLPSDQTWPSPSPTLHSAAPSPTPRRTSGTTAATSTSSAYAVEFGAVGATANPTIVVDNWRSDASQWATRARVLAGENPTWSERELAWGIVAEMSTRAAPLLMPAFAASGGRAGRLSIQTDPTLWRDTDALVEQAMAFDVLAPNVVVKLPATRAGIAAMEEATYRGVSINATVSFGLPQALAAAEAVQRGLDRRDAENRDTTRMGPVITIMMGRLEDWLRESADADGVPSIPPRCHGRGWPWSSVRTPSGGRAASAPACWRPRSGITFTGRS